MIDHATIERILDAADVVDVIQDYITLKRRGVNYLGHCPFHNEKTPSFTVSPSKGIFKCFGCGKGGNSVHFLMEHENLTYPEALKLLARKYNIEVVEKELSPEEKQQQNDRESMLVLTTFAQKFFSDMLKEHPEGKTVGGSYFRERGIRESMIEKFQLGYSPDLIDTFSKRAIEKGYKKEFLIKTGLTSESDGKIYDKFRGRVMFPIHSISGQVVGFGGRILRSDSKYAKYLNSPESEIYHKSKILYGLFQAKKSITETDKCYIVEGYTDVIAMHQSGVENVVASSGTALSSDQIRLIKRFTKNITLLFDGDAAGLKAAIRGVDLVLEEGLNVRIIMFPEGEDPDSFSRKVSSSELLAYFKENETDFISFKASYLLKEAAGDPVKKAGFITDVIRSISVIPDSIIRSVYIKDCSKLMEMDGRMLYIEVNKRRKQTAEKALHDSRVSGGYLVQQTEPEPETKIAGKFDLEEREICRVLLNHGSKLFTPANTEEEISVAGYIISEILEEELTLQNPVYKLIFEEFQYFLNEDKFPDEKYFVHHTDNEIGKAAADLLTTKYKLSKIHSKAGAYVPTEEMILKELVPKIVAEFKHKVIYHRLLELGEKMLNAKDNPEEFEMLQMEFLQYKKINVLFSDFLGRRIIL